MSRLTIKEYVNERIANVKNYIEFNERKDDKDFFAHKELELYQKAQKYIELTDELGCPLEVVFKAIEDGVYHKYSKSLFSICKFQKLEVRLEYKYGEYLLVPIHKADFSLSLEDYKKTWWLLKTKEE